MNTNFCLCYFCISFLTFLYYIKIPQNAVLYFQPIWKMNAFNIPLPLVNCSSYSSYLLFPQCPGSAALSQYDVKLANAERPIGCTCRHCTALSMQWEQIIIWGNALPLGKMIFYFYNNVFLSLENSTRCLCTLANPTLKKLWKAERISCFSRCSLHYRHWGIWKDAINS